MTEQSIGKSAFRGTLWVSLDKFTTIILQFIANLILARLLMPSDFGCIGMLMIFIAVSQTIVEGGFGSALIQKEKPDQNDYSTIFYWNIFLAVLLYLILFFASPFIASFYNMPILCDVLRVLGLTLITSSLTIVQNNRLRKQLAFKKLAFINIASYSGATIVSICMAYLGFGVWSLVVLQILISLFTGTALWIFAHWRPSLRFSFDSLKKLFSFGGYLLFANILQETCKNLQGLIIGKRFTSIEMGYYAQAQKLNDVSSSTLSNIIVQVMFPIYSQLQNDLEGLRNMLRRNIRIISFFTFPIMFILILIAHPLIVFLYGMKWVNSVPYFQILCIGGLFVCLQNINYYAVAALGKSDVLFKWSFYKWGALILFLLVGMQWGIYGILWGIVLSSLNIFLTNAILVSRHVRLKFIQQIKDITPLLIASIVPEIAIFSITKAIEMNIGVQILLYLSVYLILIFLFRLKIRKDIIDLMLIIRHKNA